MRLKPGDLAALLVQLVDGPEALADDLSDVREAALDGVFADLKQACFDGAQHIQRGLALVGSSVQAKLAHLHQLPQDALVLDDLYVILDCQMTRQIFVQ